MSFPRLLIIILAYSFFSSSALCQTIQIPQEGLESIDGVRVELRSVRTSKYIKKVNTDKIRDILMNSITKLNGSLKHKFHKPRSPATLVLDAMVMRVEKPVDYVISVSASVRKNKIDENGKIVKELIWENPTRMRGWDKRMGSIEEGIGENAVFLLGRFGRDWASAHN